MGLFVVSLAPLSQAKDVPWVRDPVATSRIRRHIGGMPKSADKVAFDTKPLKEGSGWYIVVTYPGGMQEHIPGFENEAEAQEWLMGKGRQTWLRARGYAV